MLNKHVTSSRDNAYVNQYYSWKDFIKSEIISIYQKYTVFYSQRISSVNNISKIIVAQVACNNMFVLTCKPGQVQSLASDNIT